MKTPLNVHEQYWVLDLKARELRLLLIALLMLCIIYLVITPLGLLTMNLLLVFIVIFITPGLCLVLLVRKQAEDFSWVLVEGFFVSTIMIVLIAVVFHALGLTVSQKLYISFTISIILLTLMNMWRVPGNKRVIIMKKHDLATLIVVLIGLAGYMCYFTGLKRVFTPDGVLYTLTARFLLNEGVIVSCGNPYETIGIVRLLLNGYFFWSFLLYVFIVLTNIPMHLVGIITLYFLVMAAMAASLLIKDDLSYLRPVCVVLVLLTPILIVFSSVVLSDIAISFYALFSIALLSRALVGHDEPINIRYAVYAFIPSIVMALIKPNVLIMAIVWLAIVYKMTRDRMFKAGLAYKLFYIAIVVPVLMYELAIDIPYIVSLWLLRDVKTASLFSRFLIVSPLERAIKAVCKPWWKTDTATLLEREPIDVLEHIYLLLSPEMSGLLITGAVVALLLFPCLKETNQHEKLIYGVLVSSLLIYGFQAVSFMTPAGVVRYSLWIRFLFVPSSLLFMDRALKLTMRRRAGLLVMLLTSTSILLYMNYVISCAKEGILVSYAPMQRLQTINDLLLQLLMLAIAPFCATNYLPKIYDGHTPSRKTWAKRLNIFVVTGLLIAITMIFNIRFASIFIERSYLYEDHGLTEMADVLDEKLKSNGLIFTNIYTLNPYAKGDVYRRILPLPVTLDNLSALIRNAPENTFILVSNDFTTSWYYYATWFNGTTSYAMDLVELNYIIPRAYDRGRVKIDVELPDKVLYFKFENMTSSSILVPDLSGCMNNGVNYGVRSIRWKNDWAAVFDGKSYIAVNNSSTLCAKEALAISFYAFINDTWTSQVIISKGLVDWWGNYSGSYMIHIYEDRIAFVLGGEFYGKYEKTSKYRITPLGVILWAPIKTYAGEWHHFLFVFDGTAMMIFIDMEQVAGIRVSGKIRITPYELNIGRESSGERVRYFRGMLADLQISTSPLDSYGLIRMFHEHFAKKIAYWENKFGTYALFRVEHTKPVNRTHAETYPTVRSTSLSLKQDMDIEIVLNIHSHGDEPVMIVVSTDRYSHIFLRNVTIGDNRVVIRYTFLKKPITKLMGGYWWRYLRWVRVMVFHDRKLIFSKLLTLVQPLTTDMALIMILLSSILIGPLAPLTAAAVAKIIRRLRRA